MSSAAPLSQRSDMVVFLNGTFVPADQAKVGLLTHALSYGTGCFEGIRGYWNRDAQETYLFRLREHFERMHKSAKILQMTIPHTVDELIEIAVELVRRNGLRENCYIKPLAYKSDEIIGVKLNGVTDHFYMIAVPMGDYVSTSGLRACVSSWRRVDDNMIPARGKITGAYVNSAFAKSEALQSGFDEAIMLTSEGHVSEGSAENIFLVINNELVTPPPSENILLGVTRDTVMQIARRELDRITRERVIDRTELYVADEIFLTGTGAQIAPVVEVDHRAIGSGKIGAIGGEIQRLYGTIVRGERTEYMDWCTPAFGGARSAARTPEPALAATAAARSNGSNGHHTATNGHSARPGANGHAKPNGARKSPAKAK
ncbi:MAG: branched-chain amino acid transaminase [Ktedonobacterales bacterium]